MPAVRLCLDCHRPKARHLPRVLFVVLGVPPELELRLEPLGTLSKPWVHNLTVVLPAHRHSRVANDVGVGEHRVLQRDRQSAAVNGTVTPRHAIPSLLVVVRIPKHLPHQRERPLTPTRHASGQAIPGPVHNLRFQTAAPQHHQRLHQDCVSTCTPAVVTSYGGLRRALSVLERPDPVPSLSARLERSGNDSVIRGVSAENGYKCEPGGPLGVRAQALHGQSWCDGEATHVGLEA
mmetsp:Transcript_19998/g.46701  ORF Transcript_19998/g.46701 Transcript_19998/m.46701 type:complete len:235 (-) Transcript_19998:11296-12000(-)